MEIKVQRWGNSLAVRLPKPVAMEAGLEEGSRVDLEAVEGKIVIRAVHRYRLSDLIAQITPRNRHAEVPTGRRRGREAW